MLLKYHKNPYVRYTCLGKVSPPRAASMLSTIQMGSQQHIKPTITAANVLVTSASSTFALSCWGLFCCKKTRFDLDTVEKTLA